MRILGKTDGEFVFFDNVIGSTITAQIKLAGKRFLLWENGKIKNEFFCSDESQKPQGYQLAYDLDLFIDGICYRLTIYEGAIKNAYEPYIQKLQSMNLDISSVITMLSINCVNGVNYIKFDLPTSNSQFDR